MRDCLPKVAAALFVCFGSAHGQSPVGLLSQVSGSVEIRVAGANAVQARSADLLGAGYRVATGKDGHATFLFCPTSRSARLMPDSEIDFSANTFTVTKGRIAEEKNIVSCRLPKLTLAAASNVQSGILRLRGDGLVLQSPSRTNVATLLPRFSWTRVEGALSYELKVLDREERVLWQHSGPEPEAAYPPEAPALMWGGSYRWRVAARAPQEIISEVSTTFRVLPEDQVTELRKAEEILRRANDDRRDNTAPRILRAFLYEEFGLLNQAAELYRELAAEPNCPEWVNSRLAELSSPSSTGN